MRRLTPLAALFFALLAGLHTWPMLRFAGSHVVDLGDGILNNWLLAAVSRRLLTHPLTVFDVNMYYPYRHALGTLDHQLSTALLLTPLAVLTDNALLPATLFTVASFALAGLFTAMLVGDLTGSVGAALLAGCVYAFSPMRLENLNHSHVLGNCWLPLALLTLQRYVREPSWKRMWLAVAAFLCLALASWYYAVIGGVAVAVVGAAELARAQPPRWRILGRALPGAAVLLVVLGAVAQPYLAVNREYLPQAPRAFAVTKTAEGRSIDRAVDSHAIAEMAAPVESYLGLAEASRAPWTAPLRSISPLPGARFFPGLAAAFFAAIAVFVIVRRQVRVVPLSWATVALSGLASFAVVVAAFDLPIGPIRLLRSIPGFFAILLISLVAWLLTDRERPGAVDGWRFTARTYLVLGAIGLLLSLGEQVKAFGLPLGQGLYPATLPPFNLLRASSRFGVLFSLGAAVLAGCGYAVVARRVKMPALRIGLIAIALVTVNAEMLVAPIWMQRVERVPDAYEWLKRAPEGPVIEFPIHGNLLALYWSLHHGHPVVNGGGAIQPAAFRRLEDRDDLSPDMLDHILAFWHPRYVLVNKAAYTGDRARDLEANLAVDQDRLRFLVQFGARAIFEVVGSSRGPVVLRSYPASMLAGKRTITVRARVEPAPRGTPVLQVWGNGRLLRSASAAELGADPLLVLPVPAETKDGLNLEVMGDYTLPSDGRETIGRTGRPAPADIALTVTPERTRLEVNGHVWIGEKGYTVAAFEPGPEAAEVRVFNTSWSEEASHAMAAYLHQLPRGSIVAVASFYDASRALTEDAVGALAAFGLTGDLRGRFQWAHAGIGVKGAPPGSAIESIGEFTAECRVGEPARVNVDVEDVRID